MIVKYNETINKTEFFSFFRLGNTVFILITLFNIKMFFRYDEVSVTFYEMVFGTFRTLLKHIFFKFLS